MFNVKYNLFCSTHLLSFTLLLFFFLALIWLGPWLAIICVWVPCCGFQRTDFSVVFLFYNLNSFAITVIVGRFSRQLIQMGKVYTLLAFILQVLHSCHAASTLSNGFFYQDILNGNGNGESMFMEMSVEKQYFYPLWSFYKSSYHIYGPNVKIVYCLPKMFAWTYSRFSSRLKIYNSLIWIIFFIIVHNENCIYN